MLEEFYEISDSNEDCWNMKIHELMYVTTLRCNLQCAHCGQDKECAEIDCNIIKKKLLEIPVENAPKLEITGGEPFLTNGIVEFIADLANLGWFIHITTNGSYTDKIEKLLLLLRKKRNISLSISIDGLEKTHNAIRGNKNSYKLACKSLKMISQHGVQVNINTVVQPSNIDELTEFEEEITKYVGVHIPIAYAPVVSEASPDKSFVFTEKQISKIYPLISGAKDKKYILAGNKLKIEHCHAGMNTAIISPDGKVYTCLTGFSYFDDKKRKNYLMGDLKKDSIQDIYEKLDKSWHQVVKNCKGCSNSCELNREELYFGFNSELSVSELKKLKKIYHRNNSEMKLLFIKGWHGKEKYDWGEQYWMKQVNAQLLLKIVQDDPKKINITYYNGINEKLSKEPMVLSLKLNKKITVHNLILKDQDTIVLLLDGIYKKNDVLELDFLINQVWRPCDIFGTEDRRTLGIAIAPVEINYKKDVL